MLQHYGIAVVSCQYTGACAGVEDYHHATKEIISSEDRLPTLNQILLSRIYARHCQLQLSQLKSRLKSTRDIDDSIHQADRSHLESVTGLSGKPNLSQSTLLNSKSLQGYERSRFRESNSVDFHKSLIKTVKRSCSLNQAYWTKTPICIKEQKVFQKQYMSIFGSILGGQISVVDGLVANLPIPSLNTILSRTRQLLSLNHLKLYSDPCGPI